MTIKLGINLNCFTNRYVEADDWVNVIHKLEVRYVQFNADIIDPFLPYPIQERLIKETNRLCQEHGITVVNNFGGHNHHQNYLGHPDNEVAKWYEDFYVRLIRQTAMLNADGVGTCFAIMTVRDGMNLTRRSEILKRAVDAYARLGEVAKKEGLKYLLFETTSVPRETCATFEETDWVLDQLKNMAVPMKTCLDVGHRNMANPQSPDASYAAWIERYGKVSPVIHLQQTDNKQSAHWPFTANYNQKGDVDPVLVMNAVKKSGLTDTLLCFETKQKAFHPDENTVIENLKESVQYWRGHIHD